MELIKLKRATYRGVGLFVDAKQLNRVTAFGATGTLSKEEVFELANPDIIDIVEDSPEVSMTIDSNEYGTLDTLRALSKTTGGKIEFSKAFENTQVSIWNYVKANADSNTIYTQIMTGCVLTNYSANFSTDGNATESFSLTADNKTWLLNDGVHAAKLKYEYSTDKWASGITENVYAIAKVLEVELDGRIISPSEYNVDAEFNVTFKDGTSSGNVNVFTAGKVGGSASAEQKKLYGSVFEAVEPSDFTKTIKRRGHIEVYLIVPAEGEGEDKEIRVNPAQSVSIDASLSREDITALGYKRFYDRPLSLPIDVTASIDIIFTDLEIWGQLAGKDDIEDVTSLSLDDFRDDLGLKVKIYDRTDIDGDGRDVVKTLTIPRIFPTDEAWNISLDGQATQTFSFRGMELIADNK